MMLLSMIITIINITDNMRDDLEANRVLAPLIEHTAETQHVQCNTHYFDAPSWRNPNTNSVKTVEVHRSMNVVYWKLHFSNELNLALPQAFSPSIQSAPGPPQRQPTQWSRHYCRRPAQPRLRSRLIRHTIVQILGIHTDVCTYDFEPFKTI
jgi:hypothetical protein